MMVSWGTEPLTWHFWLGSIPIRVHFSFWISALILGLGWQDPVSLVAWVLAMFVGILVHELGHALAMRRFGFRPEITLYAFGGLTEYGMATSAATPMGPWGRIQVSAAGPVAGLVLAAAVAAIVDGLGGQVAIFLVGGIIPVPVIAEQFVSPALTALLQSLIWIGFVWGLINLMPVFPLDGGHIARELLMLSDPQRGLVKSIALSFYCALFLAAVGLFVLNSLFMFLLFAAFAYNSYNLLRGAPPFM